MKYKDEEIILLRNNRKKRTYVDSTTGMYVGDLLLKFYKMELFKNCTAMIPEIFAAMDLKLAEKKYPSVYRPQIILTNEDGTVNFTFGLYENAAESGTAEGAIGQFKIIIRTAQPSNRFMGEGMVEGMMHQCSWMAFLSNSLDGVIYNMLSLTMGKKRFILGMFNCPQRDWILWNPLMLEVLNTIYIEEDDE